MKTSAGDNFLSIFDGDSITFIPKISNIDDKKNKLLTDGVISKEIFYENNPKKFKITKLFSFNNSYENDNFIINITNDSIIFNIKKEFNDFNKLEDFLIFCANSKEIPGDTKMSFILFNIMYRENPLFHRDIFDGNINYKIPSTLDEINFSDNIFTSKINDLEFSTNSGDFKLIKTLFIQNRLKFFDSSLHPAIFIIDNNNSIDFYISSKINDIFEKEIEKRRSFNNIYDFMSYPRMFLFDKQKPNNFINNRFALPKLNLQLSYRNEIGQVIDIDQIVNYKGKKRTAIYGFIGWVNIKNNIIYICTNNPDYLEKIDELNSIQNTNIPNYDIAFPDGSITKLKLIEIDNISSNINVNNDYDNIIDKFGNGSSLNIINIDLLFNTPYLFYILKSNEKNNKIICHDNTCDDDILYPIYMCTTIEKIADKKEILYNFPKGIYSAGNGLNISHIYTSMKREINIVLSSKDKLNYTLCDIINNKFNSLIYENTLPITIFLPFVSNEQLIDINKSKLNIIVFLINELKIIINKAAGITLPLLTNFDETLLDIKNFIIENLCLPIRERIVENIKLCFDENKYLYEDRLNAINDIIHILEQLHKYQDNNFSLQLLVKNRKSTNKLLSEIFNKIEIYEKTNVLMSIIKYRDMKIM